MDTTADDTTTISRPGIAEATDGRRMRAERNRAQIVDAMIALIRKGEIMPSAERVSDEAGVGLRTVFRHFEDMDSLFQEVAERIEAEVSHLVAAPFLATAWRDRLAEMVERRAQLFECIMPFKVQAEARRLQSAFLQERKRCAVEADIARLREVVPPAVREDEALFAALCAGMSFDVWRRLREDQKKTPDEARQAMHCIVECLVSRA